MHLSLNVCQKQLPLLPPLDVSELKIHWLLEDFVLFPFGALSLTGALHTGLPGLPCAPPQGPAGGAEGEGRYEGQYQSNKRRNIFKKCITVGNLGYFPLYSWIDK